MDWIRHAAGKMVAFLIRRGLRRQFRGVQVAGGEHVSDLTGSVLLTPNHSNWWDGFVCLLLMKAMPGRRLALMQERKHLDRYPFFRFVGVFGIDRETDRRSLPGIREALGLLENSETALWMFPQGELLPPKTEVETEKGVAFLAEKSGARVVPVGFRYEWLDQQKPTVLVRFGPPLAEGEDLGEAIASLLARIDEDVLTRNLERYRFVEEPRPSLNTRWDRWQGSQ